MLFLLLKIGTHRYAVPARDIVEVVPYVKLKPLPHTPGFVSGVFTYRGWTVPAIDMSSLVLGRPAYERLSTRIIIVKCKSAQQTPCLLGLIAEEATGTFRVSPQAFSLQRVDVSTTPYLGPVLFDEEGPLQVINEQQLLAPALKQQLFSEQKELVSSSPTVATET